jgi:hypothetical protein
LSDGVVRKFGRESREAQEFRYGGGRRGDDGEESEEIPEKLTVMKVEVLYRGRLSLSCGVCNKKNE